MSSAEQEGENSHHRSAWPSNTVLAFRQLSSKNLAYKYGSVHATNNASPSVIKKIELIRHINSHSKNLIKHPMMSELFRCEI